MDTLTNQRSRRFQRTTALLLVLCLLAAPATASVAGLYGTPSTNAPVANTTIGSSTDQFGPDDWPTYQYDGARTGSHPTATAPQGNVSVAWNATGDRKYSPPVIYDGTVYVTNGTGMEAYDAATGQQQWATPMNTGAYDFFDRVSPVVLDDRVFAVAGKSLFGYNHSTGALEVTYEMESYLANDGFTPAASETLVFLANDGEDPNDLDLDGRVAAVTADGTEVWNYSLSPWPTGPLAHANGTVYVENIFNVTAFNATWGTVEWDRSLARYLGVVTVSDDHVYVSATGGNNDFEPNDYVYALNASTGATEWRFNVSAQLVGEYPDPDYANPSTTVVTDGSTLYVGDLRGNLYALDTTDGTIQWERTYDENGIEDVDDFLLLDGTLYVASNDTMHALDASNGDFHWNYTMPAEIEGVAVSDGKLYVTAGGTVTVLQQGVRYSDLTVSATELDIGDAAIVSATVTNAESDDRAYTAKLTVDGSVVDQQTGTLAAGDSTTVSFVRTFDAPKDHAVTIGNHPSQSEYAPIVVSVGPQPTGEWPSLRGNAQGTGVVGTSPPIDNVSVFWDTTIDGSHNGFTSPVVSDGIVYFVGVDEDGDSGGLAAFDAATGEEYWHVGEELYSTPTVHNGTVFASVYSTSGYYYIYAMDASSTKDRKWSVRLGDYTSVQGSLTVANGTVFVPGYYGDTLYALDEDDGSEIWTASVSNDVDTTPAVAGDLVYAGDDDGYVYAFDVDTGATVWNTTSLGYDVTSPAVDDGTVFVTVDSELYALTATTGAIEWNRSVPYPADSAPVVVDGRVIIGDSQGGHGGVSAYDAATGDLIWNYTIAGGDFRIPAVANGVVYVVDQYESLMAFDAATGDVLFTATGFDPEETPAIVDNYIYVYGDPNYDSLVALNGTTATVPTPSIVVGSSGSFGDVSVGSTAVRNSTIANDGDAAVEITATSVTGTNADAFEVVAGDAPFVLAPNDSRAVTVEFAPTLIGTNVATLELSTNASAEPRVDVPLSGAGVGSLSLNETTVAFGQVARSATATAAVLVTNDGSSMVAIDEATFAGSDPAQFDVSTAVPVSLAPGESRVVELEFTPGSDGYKEAVLSLGTTDANVPGVEVTVTGEGVSSDATATPTSIDFGSQTAGTSTEQDLTVTNLGSSLLTVSSVDASGSAFTVAGSGGFTLAPAQSRTITVAFSPAASGSYTGGLTVASDDPNEPTIAVALSGAATTDSSDDGAETTTTPVRTTSTPPATTTTPPATTTTPPATTTTVETTGTSTNTPATSTQTPPGTTTTAPTDSTTQPASTSATEPPTSASPPTDSGAQTEDPDGSTPGFGVITALFAALTGLLAARLRRT